MKYRYTHIYFKIKLKLKVDIYTTLEFVVNQCYSKK